jgi:ribosome-binding factor A
MALKPKLKERTNILKQEALKEVSTEKMVTLTINVPESLRSNFKIQTIHKKTNITEVLINFIKEYLK